MKTFMRLATFLFIALCILLVVILAKGYFFSLLEELGAESESVEINLPTPFLLLFVGAIFIAFSLCALILLRSFAKIKRKESEARQESEDEDTF